MPTLTTPLGPISLAQELLRASLAACKYFQTFCGVDSSAEALLRIWHEGLPPPANFGDRYTLDELAKLRPYCVIYTDEQAGFSMRHDSTDDHFRYRPSGVLIARFERALPKDVHNDFAEADRRLRNLAGQIMFTDDADNPGLADLAGQGGYLAIEKMTFSGIYHTPEEEIPAMGQAQAFYIDVEWGTP
jgi:hypothetical protein